MFRSIVIGCVALAAGSGIAIGAPQDDLKAAAQKLSDASSYSWKTTIQAAGGNNNRGGGPSEGKTEKDGYTMVTMTFGENTTIGLRKGEKVVVKTEDGWKTQEELASGGGRNPGRFIGMATRNLPAKTVEDLAGDVTALTTTPDGFAGQLTEDGAKKAMTFRGGRRGGANANANANPPQISDAKGDVKFMTKDGVLTGYELHVTGKMSFNGNDRDIDRTTKVEFSEVGSTKIEVPDEAKKKIEE